MQTGNEWVGMTDGDACDMGEGVLCVQKDEYGVAQSVFLTKADLEKLLGLMA